MEDDLQTKLIRAKFDRALRAKRRFRATIRQVIQNLPWLQDNEFESLLEIPIDNIQQKIKYLIREKRKGKLLTIKEKGILRKHVDWRTDEEKRHLFRVLGGLKCFRGYPPNVQEKLVATTYFEFYEGGRTLLREGHEAFAMYFIVTGEVLMSQTIWDEVESQWISVPIARFTSGGVFGEIALLHNEPRVYTTTTVGPCELLCLKKDDFNQVLKETLKKHWDNVLEAMATISYFNNWDKIAKRECCLLAKLKYYQPNEVIMGEEVATSKNKTVMMYFIIEGMCKIVEHLMVIEEVKRGIRTCKLYDPDKYTAPEPNWSSLFDVRKLESERMKEGNTLKSQDTIAESKVSSVQLSSTHQLSARDIRPKGSRGYSGRLKRIPLAMTLPPEVKVHFMQVCELSKGCCFKNDHHLINRRVISVSPVKCLLIPDYWLSLHNEDNVWPRVRLYLSHRIPTRETVLNGYNDNLKWMEYKKKIKDDLLAHKKLSNNATIHDVPYSIRIMHGLN